MLIAVRPDSVAQVRSVAEKAGSSLFEIGELRAKRDDGIMIEIA